MARGAGIATRCASRMWLPDGSRKPVSTPHGCSVRLGEVDAARLERLVLGLDVVRGQEERADRALAQQLAQLAGDLGA